MFSPSSRHIYVTLHIQGTTRVDAIKATFSVNQRMHVERWSSVALPKAKATLVTHFKQEKGKGV